MAWFTCMAGVGGKGNSVIVTCDADFAGIPITCTNGQKTYTKVCPSFSPYEVTFSGLVAGTWTISATVDGVVYSTTAIVTDITAVLSYGFNWQMWVDSSSSLHSEDYNDLSDLLSDEAAIRQLFTEHAPTDYAASTATVTPDLATVLNNDLCAKWINLRDYALDTLYANPLIAAAMDSADKYFYGEWGIVDDTTTPPTWGPKGNVPIMTSNTAPYGTASAYQVFDGNASTTASGTDFSYKFVNPICPKDFYCNVSGGTLQASNDGSTYSAPTSGSYYLYLRLHFASSVSPHTIQFYGRELSDLVPPMISATVPSGEAFASSVRTGQPYYAWKAFDNDLSTFWQAYNVSPPQWIGYKFTNKVKVEFTKFVDYASRTYTFTIQGSNDNTDWKDITESQTISSTVENTEYWYESTKNVDDYLYYRINFTSFRDSSNIQLVDAKTVQFYGKDYSEREFESGATKKWLYDHGVNVGNVGASSGAILDSDCAKLTAQWAQIYKESIDLTPYSSMRAKVGKVVNATSWVAVYSGNTSLAEKQITANDMPNNIGLDVSTINQSVKVLSNISSAGETDIAEWWLE